MSGRFLDYAHPLHLWFLEYLIVLYLLAMAVVWAISVLLPAGLRATLMTAFRWAVASIWAPFLFAVPSFLAHLAMRQPWLEDPPSFIPVPRIVITYAIPFAFGWLLFCNADLLEILRRRARAYTLLALIPCMIYLGLFVTPIDPGISFYASRAAHSLALWLLIFGVTGLFLRYLSGHNPLLRYLSDSSYFLYVASMPVILAFQLLLMNLGWSPLVKIVLVLMGSVAVLLVIYRYAVRPTFIGAALNGRKYPLRPAPFAAAVS